jgi:hemerythrin
MLAKGFAGYKRHKAEHVALVGITADLQTKFHAGQAEITEDVAQLLKACLDSHIPTFDKAYADTLNS